MSLGARGEGRRLVGVALSIGARITLGASRLFGLAAGLWKSTYFTFTKASVLVMDALPAYR